MTGFISNLVIHLSDVHIRVETPTGTLGARMQAFALTTTDAQWHPANVEAGATGPRYEFNLKHFLKKQYLKRNVVDRTL